MVIKAENTSEAHLFPRQGRVQEVSATYQITFTGGDLIALRRHGHPPHVIEQAILDFFLRGGALP